MDQKIIFLKVKIKKVCSDIIDRLDGEDLIFAYLSLKNLSSCSQTVSEITNISESAGDYTDYESIKLQYENKLKAAGKAKITIKNYMVEVGKFLIFLQEGNHDLEILNSQILDNYLSKAKSERGLSRNPYSKLVVIIRGFLHFLYKSRIVQVDLADDLATPKKVRAEREYLSESDIQMVEEYLNSKSENYKGENQRDIIIFYLGVYCGLRKSEIINLKWQDIDFNECKIKILNSKGGKDRIVYFNGKLKGVLLKYRKTTKNYDGAVVHGNFGRRITSTALFNIVSKIFMQSGIYRKGLTIHSLRHSYAESLRKKKVDMNTIKALLGHSSLETTEAYLHTSPSDLKSAIM